MQKWTFASLLAILVLVATVVTTLPATATTETSASSGGRYALPSGFVPFTAETNYMSLPGFLRHELFEADGVWVTRLEAVRAVKAEGADATLGCRDAMTLNGCKPPVGG